MSDAKLQLYNDILGLVEEELHQRRTGGSYDGKMSNQTGGGPDSADLVRRVQYPFVPGKFDAIRHSMNLPLDVAVRGAVERQKLFAQENNL